MKNTHVEQKPSFSSPVQDIKIRLNGEHQQTNEQIEIGNYAMNAIFLLSLHIHAFHQHCKHTFRTVPTMSIDEWTPALSHTRLFKQCKR